MSVLARAQAERVGPGQGLDGISFNRISKAYVDRQNVTTVLNDVSFEVRRGQFVTIIGPSGCGKSTLLKMAAGLVQPDAGSVSVFGQGPDAACEAKEIGLVPQTPALLQWRTVLANVTLPSELNRRAERRRSGVSSGKLDPMTVLDEVGLADFAGKRPSQLSGGMQQRVAIARAFCFGSSVLLMDEPFSALDEFTRESLRFQLLSLWEKHQKTVLFVTHSIPEAVLLSDAVVVMSSRPASIRTIVPIRLSRPRAPETEDSPEFIELVSSIRAAMREEFDHDRH